MILIFIGPPGSGKGTQAKILAKSGYVHISVGDLLREEVCKNTSDGKDIASYIDKGLLVPQKYTDKLLINLIAKNKDEKIILDGYPRNSHQLSLLNKILADENIENYKIINFDISEQILVSRITGRVICSDCGAIYNLNNDPNLDKCIDCGSLKFNSRTDDNEESLKQRLSEYYKQTAPVIELLSLDNNFCKVAANQSAEKVTEDIDKVLN